MKIFRLIITLWITACSLWLHSQQEDNREEYYKNLVQFSGAVVTRDSLRPVSFTQIIDRKTGFGTITDFFGKLREEGKTILISTHVSNLAKLADKTYLMKDGRIMKPA